MKTKLFCLCSVLLIGTALPATAAKPHASVQKTEGMATPLGASISTPSPTVPGEDQAPAPVTIDGVVIALPSGWQPVVVDANPATASMFGSTHTKQQLRFQAHIHNPGFLLTADSLDSLKIELQTNPQKGSGFIKTGLSQKG